MARRLEKRKRPSREEKPFNAVTKITHHVFDDKTIEVIVHLKNNGVITGIDYPIAEGKEANVFKARGSCDARRGGAVGATPAIPGVRVACDVAVKVFKYETSSFLKRSMLKYIEGDPRFPSLRLSHRSLVKLWARKEFSNLKAAQGAKVSAPAPLKCRENVIVMQFLGEGGISYTLLKDFPLERAQVTKLCEKIVANIAKFWKAGFVHADLNEFNILTDGEKIWFIDFAQAVRKEHPLAKQFLEKDCENIAKFFAKKGVPTTREEILASVLKQ